MQLATVKAFIGILFVNDGECRTEELVEEFDVIVNNDWSEQTIFDKLDYVAVLGKSDLFDALNLPEKYGDNAQFSLAKIEILARAPRRLLSINSDGIYDDAYTELADGPDSDGDSDSDYGSDPPVLIATRVLARIATRALVRIATRTTPTATATLVNNLPVWA